jgi:hypothetical protein
MNPPDVNVFELSSQPDAPAMLRLLADRVLPASRVKRLRITPLGLSGLNVAFDIAMPVDDIKPKAEIEL